MKSIIYLISVLLMPVVFQPASGKPIKVDGVYVSSMNGRAGEIFGCIKSGMTDCLYPKKESQTDQVILFGGNSIILPPFELGCTIDVIGTGELVGGKIDHFVGVCLSPGGAVNFSGYLMFEAKSKPSFAGITGPSHVVWSSTIAEKAANGAGQEEISFLVDQENTVNSRFLNIVECPGISPRHMKKLFAPNY